MAFETSSGDDLKAEINVTPLVDVVLVLLIVFMVMTPLLQEELPVDLPIAESGRPADTSAQVKVSLGADARIRVDGVDVPRAELRAHLAARVAGHAEPTIFLEADRSLPHGAVVELMDEARAAGIVRIGVLTQGAEAAQAPPGG